MRIQNYPNVDSVNVDAFENLTKIYFEFKGYFTSSNKWFWCYDGDKQQRGYQDIDVLAFNENEVCIVQVSTCLDTKIHYYKKDTSKLHEDMLDKLVNQDFKRVILYLENVPEYKWIMKNRKIRKIIAYIHNHNLSAKLQQDKIFIDSGIELLSAQFMIEELKEMIRLFRESGLRTNNSVVNLFQFGILGEAEK